MSGKETPARGPVEDVTGLDDDMPDLITRARDRMGLDVSSGTDRSVQVTPSMCALLRYAAEEMETKKAVADAFDALSHDTVIRHTNGNCSCDERSHVHYQDCMRMRNRYRKGAPFETLALLNGVKYDTVRMHVSGRCGHEDGVEPATLTRGPDPQPDAASSD